MENKTRMCFVLLVIFVGAAVGAEGLDGSSASDVAKAIAQWRLTHASGQNGQEKVRVLVSQSVLALAAYDKRANQVIGVKGLVSGSDYLSTSPPHEPTAAFEAYINTPTSTYYPVDSFGMSGMGARPRPGERVYVNFRDPFAYLPTMRNITAIPTQSGPAVGVTLGHIEWGSGFPRKTYGSGTHDFDDYSALRGTASPERITVHSMGNFPVDALYRQAGYPAIAELRGMTVLGAGNSPIDAGRGQIAFGTNSFGWDVLSAGIPGGMGFPVGTGALHDFSIRPATTSAASSVPALNSHFNLSTGMPNFTALPDLSSNRR